MPTTPRSWATQGRKLGDIMSVQGDEGIAQNIQFNEWGEPGSRNERWSSNSTSAATMRFAVNADALRDPVRRRILHDSILGGFSTSNNKKNQPYQHPYGLGMFAKDVVGLDPKATNEQPSGLENRYLLYNVEVITVSFESLPYRVNAGSGGQTYSWNWMEMTGRPGSNRVQTPLGWYVFSTGAYSGWASLLGSFRTMPVNTMVLTIHQVTHNQIFGNEFSFYPTFTPNFGQVNAAAFAGWGAEKLLLDGAEYRCYHNMVGERLYDIRLVFAALDWGWNKSLDPGNSVESIRLGSLTGPTTVKPFTTFGLGTMLTTLNPL